MDEGSELKQMMKSVVNTPHERSQKLLTSIDSKTIYDQSQASVISSDEEN